MGYNTRVTGAILITPPLTAAELRAHPEVKDGDCAYVQVNEEPVETDEGTLIRTTGNAIVPWRDEEYKAYDLVEQVQHIVSTFPDRAYEGRFDCYGEENPDIWRLVIRDGRAVQIRPQLIWPDEAGDHAGRLASQL
jgi:hypothetical protein